jgi:hypothetical protein
MITVLEGAPPVVFTVPVHRPGTETLYVHVVEDGDGV